MKYIHKAGEPREYADWRKKVQGTEKADFREIPKTENGALLKGALLNALLAEQGWLCAYTMRRVENESAHVEHLKPESLCRKEQPESDLDYQNMVACFPREGMKLRYQYGAQAKGDWWDQELFASPLHPNCETRFRFDLLGNITFREDDAAAKETVKRLALNHDSLVEDRKRVIDNFIADLSKAQVERWILEVTKPRKDGRFIEFCVAIRSALEAYLQNLEKYRRKRAFAKRMQS
jgi:uncharacterized protein (TIGR02646 family)